MRRKRETEDIEVRDGREITTGVRGLATGGAMVGRVTGPEDSGLVGMTAFVPFAAPGETVRARVVKQAARYLEAELEEVLEASPERTEPRCPYFGSCGGCDIQHLNYEEQLRAKREMIVGAFRSGGFGPDVLERINEAVPGPPYHYRQRITLHIRKGRAGYFRRRSHRILPVVECPISVPALEAKLADPLELGAISDGELTLEVGENGVFAVLRTDAVEDRDRRDLLRWLRGRFNGGAVFVGGVKTDTFGETVVQRPVEGLEGPFHMAPGEFAQTNAAINAALIRRILAIAGATGARTASDLYAGSGNFAVPLTVQGLQTVAVEESEALVAAGRAEAERRGISARLTFHHTTVERYVLREPKPTDLIVADPPRAGLEKLVPHFGFAPQMILISCDLASAVRDVRELGKNGWTVREITPYDMFAQTGHVELLTWLTRA